MSYIAAAAAEIARRIHPGILVILESTTYPGMTEEFHPPKALERLAPSGKDFFQCFSPERVDPGNPHHHTAIFRSCLRNHSGMHTPACISSGGV